MDSVLQDGSWIPPLIALMIAVGGTWWAQRSTGAKEITEATKALLGPMTDRIESMEENLEAGRNALEEANAKIEENNRLLKETQDELRQEKLERAKDRRRLTAVEKWARALRDQVIELGGTPVPFEDYHD